MKKAELETALAKERRSAEIYKKSLVDIRQVARDCVKNGTKINNVWVIEEVTHVLTKAEL